MRELSRWLEQQARRQRRVVRLEEALLHHRFPAYALYRLRYFFARYGATSAVHALTGVLLYRTFWHQEFHAIVIVFVGASLLSSFWWGALEVMRGRVRFLYRSGRPLLIPGETGRWLGLSVQLALATLGATAGWSLWRLASAPPAFGAGDLYIVAVLVRLALGFVTRCYHSGIYALQRIYRPLPAVLAVDFVGLMAVLALWPWLGAWGFGVAAILSTLTVAALTIGYTRRVYRFFGFSPARHLTVRKSPLSLRGSRGELLSAGLSYALARTDALLVLVLIGTLGRSAEQAELPAFFFIISPTIRAAFGWAQLLYFDLKRLEIKVFRNLRRRFEKFLARLAVVLGFLFWAVAGVIGTLGYGLRLAETCGLLLPFFLAHSLLALAQIEAFAERAYRRLWLSGLGCLAGLVAVRLLVDGWLALLGLAVVALAGFAFLRAGQADLRREGQHRSALGLAEWLAQLGAVRGPVRLTAARLQEGWEELEAQARRQRGEERRRLDRQIGDQIAGRLQGAGAVAVTAPGRVAWFERADGPARVTKEWVMVQGSGIVEWLGDTGVQGDGASALDAACRRRLLGPDLHREWARRNGVVGAAEVEAAFARIVPQGAVYRPEAPVAASVEALSASDMRLVLSDAAVFARDFRPSPRPSPLAVTAFCEGGELRLLFVVDRRTDRPECSRWEAVIRQLNLQVALSAAAANGWHPEASSPSRATGRVAALVRSVLAVFAG